uniref:hypothetical protein n=1 Tax=Ruminococcus bromii TaxID=40518 RepID=UPI004024D003
ELCREYNLSVIEKPINPGKCYYEWQQDYLGKSWKSKLRCVIDETIMQSTSFEDFLEQLKKKNVECIYTPENVIKIKFRLQGQQRFSRGRTLGWYYDEPQLRKRIEQYQFLKTGKSGKTYRTRIIDTSTDVFQTSKGLLHWANIKNMQEVSKLINFLSENNMRSESDIENRAAEKYNDRMVIVSKLNRTQNQINDIADVIKLIRTYEKYKPYHKNLMTAKNQKQYKKENITALAKYDDAVAKLLSLYPDRKLPTISTLEEKRKKLTSDVQQMNEEYKAIIDELKKIEYARQSINDYLRNNDRSQNKSLE